MQSSSTSSVAQPEAILDWLQKEMDYRPLGPYLASSKASMPSSDAIRRVCRGNMIPVFDFLLKRVKSEKTVNNIRRNILVYGREDNASGRGGADAANSDEVGKGSRGGRRKEKLRGKDSGSTSAGIDGNFTVYVGRAVLKGHNGCQETIQLSNTGSVVEHMSNLSNTVS